MFSQEVLKDSAKIATVRLVEAMTAGVAFLVASVVFFSMLAGGVGLTTGYCI